MPLIEETICEMGLGKVYEIGNLNKKNSVCQEQAVKIKAHHKTVTSNITILKSKCPNLLRRKYQQWSVTELMFPEAWHYCP
jgi:hypothetical protein